MAFKSYGHYMDAKKRKLDDQMSHDLPERRSMIFSDVVIYVTGYTEPSRDTLKATVVENGGRFLTYFDSSVSHVLATTLSLSRAKDFMTGSCAVVKPSWIVDSVKNDRLLPKTNYIVFHPTKGTQAASQAAARFFKPTSVMSVTKNVQDTPEVSTWIRENSSMSPDFVRKFFASSRLHYLSTWKTMLQSYTRRDAQLDKIQCQRIIFHLDMDCFFASVAVRDRPELKDKPVGISHGQGVGESKSSDVASCNYAARTSGVKNGMSVGRAKTLCPDLVVLPYEYEKYKQVTDQLYTILERNSDAIQAVSCDEVFMEVTLRCKKPVGNSLMNRKIESMENVVLGDHMDAVELAVSLQREIKRTTGCDASVGISHNILLARLATRRAKPYGVYYYKSLREQDDLTFVDSFSVENLPGVGYATHEKLSVSLGKTIDNCCALRTSCTRKQLIQVLGNAAGVKVWDALHGRDGQLVAMSTIYSDISDNLPKTIGAEISWGVRFENEQQLVIFMNDMAAEVSNRMKNEISTEVTAKTITVKLKMRCQDAPIEPLHKNLGCGPCDTFSRLFHMDNWTNDASNISQISQRILATLLRERFNANKRTLKDVRGIGISMSNIQPARKEDTSPRKIQTDLRHFVKAATVPVALKRPVSPDLIFTDEDEDDDVIFLYSSPAKNRPISPTSSVIAIHSQSPPKMKSNVSKDTINLADWRTRLPKFHIRREPLTEIEDDLMRVPW